VALAASSAMTRRFARAASVTRSMVRTSTCRRNLGPGEPGAVHVTEHVVLRSDAGVERGPIDALARAEAATGARPTVARWNRQSARRERCR